MSHAAPATSLTTSTSMQLDRNRLNLLLPEMAQAASPDLLAYALAFVAHYQRDVVQLEHEWEWLVMALRLAWQRGDDAAVVRLAIALAHPAGRIADKAAALEVLRRGIVASRWRASKEIIRMRRHMP